MLAAVAASRTMRISILLTKNQHAARLGNVVTHWGGVEPVERAAWDDMWFLWDSDVSVNVDFSNFLHMSFTNKISSFKKKNI